jgi:tRNA(Glu) U13 pseudouridine synthase TruD
MLEGKKCLETFLLEGLSKSGKDLVAALKVLPRNTRLMFVHAYQSYIWNVVVSRRIKVCHLNNLSMKLFPNYIYATSNGGSILVQQSE